MKAQTIAMWQYVVLLTVLLVIVVATQPLSAGEKVAQLNDARLHALEIAGIINMMEASPSGSFEYTKDLPDKCKTVEIENGFVNISTDSISYIASITAVPDVSVNPASIDCKNQRTLQFFRRKNVIEVQ